MLPGTMEVDTHLHITAVIPQAITMAHRFTLAIDIAGWFDPHMLITAAPAIMVVGIIGVIDTGNR